MHKELKGIKDMTDESFMTDIDILCEEHEKAMRATLNQLDETKSQLNETNNQLDETKSQLDETNNQLNETKSRLAETDNLIKASARAMLEKGMTDEEVHNITKLPLEELATMRNAIENIK